MRSQELLIILIAGLLFSDDPDLSWKTLKTSREAYLAVEDKFRMRVRKIV